ncbi:MAG: NAD(P)H-dependent oxidoreductase subunit E, partial [Spirochaetia bacterium]
MSQEDTGLITKVVKEYGKNPHRLMDIVRGVHEQAGYLSDDAVDGIARSLGVHRVQVVDMASFYTFFDREPAGTCTIRLSNCVVDRMHGMEEVARAFEKELGISFGQTTPDGMISLKYTS